MLYYLSLFPHSRDVTYISLVKKSWYFLRPSLRLWYSLGKAQGEEKKVEELKRLEEEWKEAFWSYIYLWNVFRYDYFGVRCFFCFICCASFLFIKPLRVGWDLVVFRFFFDLDFVIVCVGSWSLTKGFVVFENGLIVLACCFCAGVESQRGLAGDLSQLRLDPFEQHRWRHGERVLAVGERVARHRLYCCRVVVNCVKSDSVGQTMFDSSTIVAAE